MPLATVLLSTLIAVAAYLQALHYPFVSDDTIQIVTNTKLASLRLTELWRLFIEPYNAFLEFLPLRELSFWLDIRLFGMNPAAFRLHNIFLYVICLPLVYGTTLGVWRYFRPADSAGAPWAAATVTALFALHPALVESVVWITGRKYVLPNLFAMFALWLAVNARRAHGISAPHAAVTLIAFVAMMLSKISYFSVAPVIAMLWVVFWYDIPALDRRRAHLLWPLALLFLAGALVLIFIQVANSQGGISAYWGTEAATRSLAILGWLARLAVSPENRHFLYPVFEDPYLPAMVALGGVVLLAAAAGMVMMLKKRSLEGFALATFLLLCLPYLQLAPYISPSLVQDRYLSLAAWPVILLITALAWRLKPAPRTAVLLIIALTWSVQTVHRARDWRSLETIIDIDMRAYPGNYMPALYKIEAVQLRQGLYRDAIETSNGVTSPEFRDMLAKWVKASYAVHVEAASSGNPQEAMALLWQLGRDLEKHPPAQAQWNSPIQLFWRKGRAILKANWEQLATLFPDHESVHYNAGLWMLSVNQAADAVPHLRAATESQRLPQAVRGTAYKNLGLALLNSGLFDDAESPLRTALEQSPPDLRAHCLLAEVYRQSARTEEAAHAQTDCSKFAPAAASR